MGICYTYMLWSETDWWGEDKQQVIEEIKKEFPVSDILAQWNHFIVVDLDKNSPWRESVNELHNYCDRVYYYDDLGSEIKLMSRKQTKRNKEIETNSPANRNAVFIKQANDEWEKNYVLGIR